MGQADAGAGGELGGAERLDGQRAGARTVLAGMVASFRRESGEPGRSGADRASVRPPMYYWESTRDAQSVAIRGEIQGFACIGVSEP